LAFRALMWRLIGMNDGVLSSMEDGVLSSGTVALQLASSCEVKIPFSLHTLLVLHLHHHHHHHMNMCIVIYAQVLSSQLQTRLLMC
jgi:hypothetical protein